MCLCVHRNDGRRMVLPSLVSLGGHGGTAPTPKKVRRERQDVRRPLLSPLPLRRPSACLAHPPIHPCVPHPTAAPPCALSRPIFPDLLYLRAGTGAPPYTLLAFERVVASCTPLVPSVPFVPFVPFVAKIPSRLLPLASCLSPLASPLSLMSHPSVGVDR